MLSWFVINLNIIITSIKTRKKRPRLYLEAHSPTFLKFDETFWNFKAENPFSATTLVLKGTFKSSVCQWVVGGGKKIKYQSNFVLDRKRCRYGARCIREIVFRLLETNETQFVVCCRKYSPRIIRPCWQALSFVVWGISGWLSSVGFPKKLSTTLPGRSNCDAFPLQTPSSRLSCCLKHLRNPQTKSLSTLKIFCKLLKFHLCKKHQEHVLTQKSQWKRQMKAPLRKMKSFTRAWLLRENNFYNGTRRSWESCFDIFPTC